MKILSVMVVDRSGSMSSLKEEAETGLNELITSQKADGTYLMLYEFDSEIDKVFSGKIKDFGSYSLRPRSMTRLNDAIGTAVTAAEAKIKKNNKSRRPKLVLVTIVTDGMENNSQKYTKGQISALVESKQKEGWQFTYLCNSAESNKYAKDLKIESSEVFTSIRGAYEATNSKYSRMVSQMDCGMQVVNEYTNEEIATMRVV